MVHAHLIKVEGKSKREETSVPEVTIDAGGQSASYLCFPNDAAHQRMSAWNFQSVSGYTVVNLIFEAPL